MYTYIYIYIYTYIEREMYTYIYIYIERERCIHIYIYIVTSIAHNGLASPCRDAMLRGGREPACRLPSIIQYHVNHNSIVIL